MKISPPSTEQQLLKRVQAIAGMPIAQLADNLGVELPEDPKKSKGIAGLLLELCLGASAGSKPEPDFQQLGIELKTIPINSAGKVLESTYVSIVPLYNILGLTWENSEVKAKLTKVLWIPILTEKGRPLKDRVIGQGFLWQATSLQEAILRQDWQELMDKVAFGEIEQITAKYGKYMQVRPKGANASALTKAIGPDGVAIMTLPRGFYLRTCFTQQLLDEVLLHPSIIE